MSEFKDITPVKVLDRFIAHDAPRPQTRMLANVRYKEIGCTYQRLQDIRTFRPCPYTSWVEKLYGPEYSDPALLYVKQKEAERKNKVRVTPNFIYRGVVSFIFIACILAIVVK